MLKTRIITAVLLLAAFLLALFVLPPAGWVAAATLVVALAAWEWGGLMKLGKNARPLLALMLVLVCAGIGFAQPAALGLAAGFEPAAWRLGRWFYVPAAIFWLAVVPFWLRMRWPLSGMARGVITGLLVLLPAWLALIQLRQTGAVALLAIMAIAWIADIAAYFSGRAFGRHKLAPAISPAKTWEGAIGGGIAVIAYGFLVLARGLPAKLAPLHLLLLLVLLTALSVVGDLFESLLKRQAGLKDSSDILPGHGGVLDRIDSLTSLLPLVALVWFGGLL